MHFELASIAINVNLNLAVNAVTAIGTAVAAGINNYALNVLSAVGIVSV